MKLLILCLLFLIFTSAASAQVSASTRAQAWILGVKISRAAVAYGNGGDDAFMNKEFAAAKAAAARLGVKLDPLPPASADKTVRISTAVDYLLKLRAWNEIINKYDATHGYIFEASMKANLLYWFYDQNGNDETAAIKKVLMSISNYNDTISIAMEPLLERIEQKKDYEAVIAQLALLDTETFSELVAQMHFLELGNSFEKNQDYVTATKKYTQAILSDPSFSSPYFRRGFCYMNIKGKEPAAVADFTTFLELEKNANAKDTPAVFLNRGIAYFLLKKYTLSIKDMNEAIRLNPSYAKAYKARAMVYQALGKAAAARSDLDTAMRLEASAN